jgi:hypothetical protein
VQRTQAGVLHVKMVMCARGCMCACKGCQGAM